VNATILRMSTGVYAVPYSVFNLSGRCNYGDEEVKNAIKNGFTQVIILGAGNDSRLHRLSPLPEYIFEVDAALSQQYKLDNLPRHCMNAQVTFIPVNFEEENWLVKMMEVGGKEILQRKTLFVWEGVTYYLTEVAIRQTLRAIATFPVRSKVVFDVCNPTALQLRLTNAFLGLFGEPWLSPFDEPKLRGLLKEFGMRLQGSDGDGGDEDRLHLEIAASKASRSSYAIYQQRMRIPSHDFAQTPLLLACGVVEMSMPMQLGDRMAEEKE
jgi:methyltransferase (TIGR00027 family)